MEKCHESSSGLELQLHPLVLLNISDHWYVEMRAYECIDACVYVYIYIFIYEGMGKREEERASPVDGTNAGWRGCGCGVCMCVCVDMWICV